MKIIKTGFLFFYLFTAKENFAQQISTHPVQDSSSHNKLMTSDKHPHQPKEDSAKMDHNNMDGMKMDDESMDEMKMDHNEHSMSSAFSKNISMNRNGSGTAWLPDASPMYSYILHSKKWMFMLHENIFFRYTNQDFTGKGSRGSDQVDAPNWLMFMGQKTVAKNGLFHFSSMLSLDALSVGNKGYPLLFQSGEAYKGNAIVDRQHPHDFFSELAISYSHAFSEKTDGYIYLGYPGEPALGPVAFMHRPSAMDNPDAPISHHWIDATHITFGVATLGFRFNNFKIEGSSFTGREPDENRFNFDKPLFDSWSGRLSYNPSANWALQLSHGFIKSPELLHPTENVYRTTASAIYSLALKNKSTLNATTVWGMNQSNGHTGENAILLEGEWRKNKLALNTRYEWVQKSTEELALDENNFGQHSLFPVNAFTVGFNYDVVKTGKSKLAGGAQFTFYHADPKLDNLYGKNPMAFEVFVRLYPSMMMMK